MKIDLKTHIKANESGSQIDTLGNYIKNALFIAKNMQNARELYEKCATKDVVDLSVSELADIQQAINQAYPAGICWQIDDVFNGKEKK